MESYRSLANKRWFFKSIRYVLSFLLTLVLCDSFSPPRCLIRVLTFFSFENVNNLVLLVDRVQDGLNDFPEDVRDRVVVVFSAHSLPMKVVNRGDQYVPEVAATAHAVMERLNFSNRHVMAWQSQVGPLPWMGPQTGTCCCFT